MNTLIISNFSFIFKEFKNNFTNLFIEEMCKEFVTEQEFVKVNNNKFYLLMNCTYLKKFSTEMEQTFEKESDKKNDCKDTLYSIKLLG